MTIKEQGTTTDGSRDRREWRQGWGMSLEKGQSAPPSSAMADGAHVREQADAP